MTPMSRIAFCMMEPPLPCMNCETCLSHAIGKDLLVDLLCSARDLSGPCTKHQAY